MEFKHLSLVKLLHFFLHLWIENRSPDFWQVNSLRKNMVLFKLYICYFIVLSSLKTTVWFIQHPGSHSHTHTSSSVMWVLFLFYKQLNWGLEMFKWLVQYYLASKWQCKSYSPSIFVVICFKLQTVSDSFRFLNSSTWVSKDWPTVQIWPPPVFCSL